MYRYLVPILWGCHHKLGNGIFQWNMVCCTISGNLSIISSDYVGYYFATTEIVARAKLCGTS